MSDSHSHAEASGVAGCYDRWSSQYDDDRNPTRDLDALVLRRSSLRVHGQTVLELGAGTGKNTAWIAGEAHHVIAMDFSAGMLAQARRNVREPNVEFVEHDAQRRWPVETGAVDVVVANLVLEHVRDLAPVMAECARAVRDGGQLYLCELHPYRQLLGGQAQFTDPHTRETVYVPAFRHTVSEYVNAAVTAGFALRHIGEWLEAGAAATDPPRLLSLLFDRDVRASHPPG